MRLYLSEGTFLSQIMRDGFMGALPSGASEH